MEDIKELIPGVEDGKIKIKQHPKERITEKTIKGIWKAANSKVTITFKIGKPGSVLKVATSILKKFLPLLSKWANNYEIEHGGKREYRNFIPPNFDDDAFDIIAFDPYSTKGLTIGDIESTSTEEIYRVKVYSEFSPNDSTEYKLKKS